MEIMHGSKFKLVYTDWLIHNGERKPFGNGIHPKITEFIQYLVGTNRRIIDDYFFDTTGEEIHFYYLKNISKPANALY